MFPTLVAQARHRAELLLLARLALTAVSFGMALGLEGPGGELPEVARRGLYWTVALAFGATGVSAVFVRSVRRLLVFAGVQIALDVAIVTSLVHFSGARESLFTFLYVLVTVYGAVLFGRGGAFGAASLSAVCYAGILLAANGLWPGRPVPLEERLSLAALGSVWGIHVGALYLVGALASVLSAELQRAGQALNRSTSDLFRLRNLHQRMIESIMSGLMTTDPEGRVTSFNPEAERITGMRAADAHGKDVDDVIPSAREAVMAESSWTSSESPRARLRYSNRRGEDLHLGLAGSILWDEDGAPAGHVVIFQDVTTVVGMEQQLRTSERLAAVGEMSAKMAHEIRNPLAAISGSIQVLRSGLGGNAEKPDVARLMDIVVRETDRLNDLIRDFLQYARPRPTALKTVDVDRLVQDVLELLDGTNPDAVTVEVVKSGGLTVLADPGQLEQVLWNLCLNAVQAMPDGGQLRVTVRPASLPAQAQLQERRNEHEGGPPGERSRCPWVEILVADTGVGISLEVQEQMFEPFFTTKRQGSGLGLSTVHRIMESHGGTLQVASRQDEGTTFSIRLPRGEDPR